MLGELMVSSNRWLWIAVGICVDWV